MVTIKQADKYHRSKGKIEKTIVAKIKKHKNTVYGGKALNSHLPKNLRRHTNDYDVLAKHPKKRARELEKKLDKNMGGDLFFVKPAIHKGTYKVMSKVTESEVADFSKSDRKVAFVTKKGVRVVSIPVLEKMLKKSLNNPMAKFRHSKDREALRRIKIYKQRKRNKHKVKRKTPRKGVERFRVDKIRTKW